MALVISAVLPEKSELVLKGDKESIINIKKLFNGKPHLFVYFGKIKDVNESKEILISFPSANRETVEFFINNFISISSD